METLNIYQRINKIMQTGVYLKKGSAGQGTGVQYDELIAVMNPLLSKYGIVVTAEKVGDSRNRLTAKGNYIFESDYNITYINIDKPDDKLITLIESHAMDAGDKAPGKSITYATKTSMLKVFSIESGDNEESRSDQKDFDLISNEQSTKLYGLLVDGQTNSLTSKGQKIARAFRFNLISEIKSSKYDEIFKAAQ